MLTRTHFLLFQTIIYYVNVHSLYLAKCQMLTCKVAEGVISAVNCYKNNKSTREKQATSRMLNYLLNVKNE